MLDTAILAGLKRVNVSADKEKTKERVQALWESAPRESRRLATSDDGVSYQTIIRIPKEGSITPKVALILGESLNVDPLYLTADTDDQPEWNENSLSNFLRSKGYAKLLDQAGKKPKRKYTRRAQPIVTEDNEEFSGAESQIHKIASDGVAANAMTDIPDESADDDGVVTTLVDAATQDDNVDLDEESLVILLRALKIKAENKPNAKYQLNTITNILLNS